MTRLLLLIGLVSIALAASLFTLVYAATARWWKSQIGVNIMLLVGSLAAVTDLALVYNLIGRPEWVLYVFAAFYFAIGGAIWWRLVMLWRAQEIGPRLAAFWRAEVARVRRRLRRPSPRP